MDENPVKAGVHGVAGTVAEVLNGLVHHLTGVAYHLGAILLGEAYRAPGMGIFGMGRADRAQVGQLHHGDGAMALDEAGSLPCSGEEFTGFIGDVHVFKAPGRVGGVDGDFPGADRGEAPGSPLLNHAVIGSVKAGGKAEIPGGGGQHPVAVGFSPEGDGAKQVLVI